VQVLQLDIARAAFIRLRDVRAVELVNRVASDLAAGSPQGLVLAQVAAWQGKFNEAAKLFVANGQLTKVGSCADKQEVFPAVHGYWLF
jgi:intraflagellar transport protein 122